MGRQSRSRRKKEVNDARKLKGVKPAAKPRRRVFETARMATVCFGMQGPGDAFRAIGTGFAVTNSGAVVTAAHVLSKLDELKAEGKTRGEDLEIRALLFGPAKYFEVGQRSSLEIAIASVEIEKTAVHAHRDIACAKVVPPGGGTMHILPIDYNAKPFEGDDVATCGFPYGLDIHEGKSVVSSFLTGIVSAVVPHPIVPPAARMQYLLELPVNPGNSGGAVFDPDTGCVFGVVSRRFAPGNIPTGLSIAEPIHLAQKLIAQCT